MSDDARKRERPEERAADIGRAPTVAPSELPTATGGGRGAAGPADRVLPDQIGGYKILGLLGEGGMGVVYEAEQPHPKRKVALKVVRGGAFVNDARLRLFQREAETLARLKHPNIAAIYESGRTDDGEHFFAMELVQGPTLLDWLHGRPKSITPDELRLRLFLFRQIAEAVHYAHQRGVIHRDLKPANVIISDETTSPDLSTSGVRSPAVKILDFGLARITEGDMQATMTTEVGVIKGTLPYMSPEQARGRPEAIDVRTDVYALGVVLYEMLAGKLPYDVEKGGVPEALRAICEESPSPLSQTWSGVKRLDPDVETIVGKALEKDADRRYQSAAALAEDIDRYLASKPIEARPPSTMYQLRKFARRNRVLVAGVVATFLVLVAGVVVSTVLGLGQAAQRRASEASRLLLLGEKEIQEDPTRALAYAIASLERVDNIEVRRFALDALWRGPNYFQMGWEGFDRFAALTDFSPDGDWLAIIQNKGKAALWRPGGDPPRILDPPDRFTGEYPFDFFFTPDSDSLFSGMIGSQAVLEWSIFRGELTRSFEYDGLPGFDTYTHFPLHVFSADRRLITVASNKENTEARVLSWSSEAEMPELLGVWGEADIDIWSWAVDPTERFLAYAEVFPIYSRSLESFPGGPARSIGDHEGEEIWFLAFDHDGKRLASGDGQGGIRIWSMETPADTPLHRFEAKGAVADLAFHPNGSILVSGHTGGRSYLWSLDAPANIPPQELLHWDRDKVHDIAVHPNGRWMAASHRQGAILRPLGRTYPHVLLRDEERGRDLWYRGSSFSPDGTWIAASLLDPLRRIPLARSAGEGVVTLTEEIPSAATVLFDPAGRYLVATGIGGATFGSSYVYFKPLQGGEPRQLSGLVGNIHSLAVSRDGRLIAAGVWNGPFMRVWDIETWEHRDLEVEAGVHGIEFTDDDQVIFAVGGDLHRWNLTDPESEVLAEGIIDFDLHVGRIDLSPDGRYVLHHRGIYDLETGTTRRLESHQPAANHMVFDPTGTIVVSGGLDGIVRVGPVSGEKSHWLVGHEGMINEVAVSPDGNWILSAGADGTLRLWPMPDLNKSPLHDLPLDEFLERLRAQTNLRAAPDPESSTGYQIAWENPDFESWDDVPTW